MWQIRAYSVDNEVIDVIYLTWVDNHEIAYKWIVDNFRSKGAHTLSWQLVEDD